MATRMPARSGLDVLVTGGAGYIGSFVVRHLLDAGHRPVVLDNLYSGPSLGGAGGGAGRRRPRRPAQARGPAATRSFDAVIHCAAHIWVGKSVRNPVKYYANNTANAVQLFDLCAQYGIGNIVFSSTAAVYGQPDVGLDRRGACRWRRSIPTAPPR